MSFEPGQIITRRYFRGQHCTWIQPMQTVADDEEGVLLWHQVGSEFARLIDADGNTPHEVAIDEMREPSLTVSTWEGSDILVLMPPQAAYSVWWFFSNGSFTGWYINLEEPFTRRPDSVDTTDLALDIVVTPHRQWRWKDVDEFNQRTGNPLYFDRAAAQRIRAEGERLTKLVESAAFPFDGTHTDFRPEPHWQKLAFDRDHHRVQ
jgi:hypothetical protein